MNVEKKVFLLATPYGGTQVLQCEMPDQGYVTLAESVVIFGLPEYDENHVDIIGLKAMLKKEMAETEVKQQKIKQRIAELQCITHKPD